MKWYLAKIVYRIVCGDGAHAAQFDEQLRLIAATHQEQAFEKAMAIGHAGEESFENDRHQPVCWQFVNVAELNPIQELIDGAELYGRINEVDDADAYVNFVHHKAAIIHGQPSRQLLHLI